MQQDAAADEDPESVRNRAHSAVLAPTSDHRQCREGGWRMGHGAARGDIRHILHDSNQQQQPSAGQVTPEMDGMAWWL